MPSIVQDYKSWGTFETAGSVTAKALPSQDCKTVIIKAARSNAGNVYVGGSTVTKAAGTDTTTAGYELDAGEEVRFFIGNVSELYIICDNAGDDVVGLWQL